MGFGGVSQGLERSSVLPRLPHWSSVEKRGSGDDTPFVPALDITLFFTVASMLDRVGGYFHVAGY